jgi:ArsR family transcriptional regulator, arsenate/arsenite/antimonite-responsive transcriptional repressor
METRELGYTLRTLSDGARLRIIIYLANHDTGTTVSDLTRELRLSQPLVSWHLRKLRRAQIISTRRVGRQVICTLNRQRLAEIAQNITLWCGSLLPASSSPPSSPPGAAETTVLQRSAET